MNLDSIRNYPTGMPIPKLRLKRGHQTEGTSAIKSDENVNRGYYGGSFTGMNGAAAKYSRKVLNDGLNLCRDDTVIAQNLVALILAGVFRPAAIMKLPGKKNEQDKKYAAGHAIASGVIGFIFSCIIMYPFGRAAKKVEKEAAKYLDAQKFEKIFGVKMSEMKNSKAFDNAKSCFNMILDALIFGLLKAKMTIAMIPPILKYGFGLEKSKKSGSKEPPIDLMAKAPANSKKIGFKSFKAAAPNMAEFAGGDK